MNPQEINSVSAQPLQAGLYGLGHRLPAIADRREAAGLGGTEAELRSHHDLVTRRANELAKKRLRLASLVEIRRVDEIPTGLQVPSKDSAGIINLRAVTPGRSKSRGAESDS